MNQEEYCFEVVVKDDVGEVVFRKFVWASPNKTDILVAATDALAEEAFSSLTGESDECAPTLRAPNVNLESP